MRRFIIIFLVIAVILGVAAIGYIWSYHTIKTVTLIHEEEAILAGGPAVYDYPNVPSGEATAKCNKAIIDYSNISNGYVMVRRAGQQSPKTMKVQVIGSTTTYTYDLTGNDWVSFPLSDGNGAYQVKVYENISGTKYSVLLSQNMNVRMVDEFAPFLRTNQYVNFATANKTLEVASQLCGNCTTSLQKVKVVYDYVVKNFSYDTNKARTVQSGYLPNLDNVLTAKKGICFDYAALMTGMLRSQNVPCKLVVGYAGTAYHAWISVWSDEGWIDGVIYFDGKQWQRMDPTFVSTGGNNPAIMQYIGDGNNYTAKYFY